MSLKKLAIMLMANLMFAFGSAYFLVPSGMISGGVTGLALGLDRGFGIPKDITVWVLQVALFLLGLWLVGKTFAATTLIGSFAYPLLFSSFFGVTRAYLIALKLSARTLSPLIPNAIRRSGSTSWKDIIRRS